MPDKKLKVVGAGAGDPTFTLEIEIENIDSNDKNSTVVLDSIVATMNNDYISNPVLNSGRETYPIGDKILIMSSFQSPEPSKSGGIISNGIIHVPTEITFTSSDRLHIVYEGSLPYEINGNTILFPEGIDLVEPRVPSLQDGKQTVALHARAEDISQQGTNVFLANSFHALTKENFASTLQNLISCLDTTTFEINYVESKGYCSLFNKERNGYLGSSSDGYLTWYSSNDPDTTKALQWAIVNNGAKTSTIQNLQAVADGRASYLTANTKMEGGEVQLSENSTPWYLHILK